VDNIFVLHALIDLYFSFGKKLYCTGGRVTDEWDRRCLHALLERFFCPSALFDDYSYSPDGVCIKNN
jgi:hypothetical protein